MLHLTKAKAKGVEETENGVIVTYEVKGEEKKVEAEYVFVQLEVSQILMKLV